MIKTKTKTFKRLDILHSFLKQKESFSLDEIARELDVHRNSVSYLLQLIESRSAIKIIKKYIDRKCVFYVKRIGEA